MSESLTSLELMTIAAQSQPLPPDVIQERRVMREWSDRVGYRGCSSPGNPTKHRPWEPPFTVLPHVASNPKDLSAFIKMLRDHGWSYETDPLWNPVREYSPDELIRYGIGSGSSSSGLTKSVGVAAARQEGRSTGGVKRELDIPSDSQSSSTSVTSKTLTQTGKRRQCGAQSTELC